MEHRFLPRLSFSILLRISLLGFFLAACSPSASVTLDATVTLPPPTQTLESSIPATAEPTDTFAPTAIPIATSRGPNLEATDPETVNMASGGLQFVEFFEFWWATCQQMAPMVHGLEAKYFGKIKFSYLEISNPLTTDFQKYLGFRTRPSFYLLDPDGKILHEWIGYQTQEQFEEVFAQYAN